MQKQQYFALFSLLSHKERKAFRLFLQSPYFNRRDELIKMHDFLVKTLDAGIADVDNKKLFKKMFPNKEYGDLDLRHTAYYFKKALEQFLAVEEWQKDEAEMALSRIRIYKKKEKTLFFDKEIKNIFQLLESQPYRDLKFHFTKYSIYQELYEYTNKTKRKGAMYLQEQTDELSIFYISGILRQSCVILSHQNITASDYEQDLVEMVIKKVEDGLYLNEPAVAVYYHSLCSLRSPENHDDFEKLKSLIDLHWQSFRAAEIRDIYILAINSCIRRMNSGMREYIREGFELYRSGLQRKCLLENDTITPFTYKNVLMMGMSLKEYQWVENFLYSFKTHLQPSVRENTFNYNLAIYYFRRPDYDKAMELLQKVEFKDTFNNLDARRMLLRIYYEIGAFDALDSHLDSFRQYLNRQKDVGYHRSLYMGLIKAMKKVLRTNLNERGKREKAFSEIESLPAFAEKDWLLSQIRP